MKITHILASSALASLMLFGGAVLPRGMGPVATAEAAASVSFSIFYNDLQSHGDWVRLRGAYVFVPTGVGPHWRPYTVGHWVYGDNVGWTWASDEPFGWATYHYGRWGYDDQIGWYWVPGTRWAPAWVSWRRGGDVIAWAPLPPQGDGANVSVSISVGDIPDYYWVPVRTRDFLDVDLRVRIIDGDAERRRVVRDTEFLGVPRVRDRIVVNNVINVNVIEKETGHKVKRVAVRDTTDPAKARSSDQQVTAFTGEVQPDQNAKPRDVKDAAAVRKAKRDKAPSDNAQQTGAAPSDGTTTGTTSPPAAADNQAQPLDQAAPGNAGNANKATADQQPPKATPDNANAGKAKTDKAMTDKAKTDKAKADKAKADKAKADKAKADKAKTDKAKTNKVVTDKKAKPDKASAGKAKAEKPGKAQQQKKGAAEQNGKAKKKEAPANKRKKVPCDPQSGQDCTM